MEAQILFQGCSLEQLAEKLAPLLQISQVQTKEANEFITIDEVCELLKVNRTTVWKFTQNGKLQSFGFGKRVLYKRSEVLDAVKPLK